MHLPAHLPAAAKSFTIIAHRGYSSRAPENTFTSFDSALDAGFSHFETDVQLTADGVPVILHDERLGRTTRDTANAGAPGLQGPVSEVTWAELAQLDAGSWLSPDFAAQRVPLLADLLRRYRSRAHIHLELKSQQPELAARVAEQLVAAGWVAAGGGTLLPEAVGSGRTAAADVTAAGGGAGSDGGSVQGHAPRHEHFAAAGLTITSFHLQQLMRSRKVLPGLVHGWLIHELTEERIQEALAAGLQQLCPRANVLTPSAVQRALAAGLSVRAWGVKDMALLHRVVGCGCHGATVNWPGEAQEALAADEAAARAAAEAAVAEGAGGLVAADAGPSTH
ncbi:hypothetical protein CHLRE_02g113050v5 [Chlamydomonas reinhardtii]|uniref:glycerophosphodiester phosphodiesterase n=1 Tax=Chlamydomonas reinhardtii TaxID=3055 RepID=A8I313_CHLRE|nr:uncharacterized protein CHLRE_02g113050v5 [Chlamydomonas reinhardtii]PNW87201.1 hypothetical protein CHLRE_02g113050v5 [Chlamydomonas reinhardtii]|eukprot:XP_001699905.1 predicted protein [Chlamydomonas reinhardtii]